MSNFLYNPDRKPKEQLIDEFVIRNQIFEEIMHDLETSDMKTPEQHYLLVGQRGTGKTTLLHLLKYAIEDSSKLNTWLIPIIFSEEQYNISELANLWENVGHILEDYYGFEHLYEEMERFIDKENLEELCYDILEKHLKKHNKKLVLLIDNIGDLLKKIDDKEVRRLREILQTKPDIRLIAGSPFYLDNILDYKQPFFEFFKVKMLDSLSREEAEKLLLKLGEVYDEKDKIQKIVRETPERIETLRILTGGVPRTIALMFRIFVDYEHESSIKDLERILDAVTPLYKHRMDDLPKQQQKIVDAVARNWDAISVKELKEKVRLDSKVISAQLRQLEKNQVIEKRETNTKNHLYLLKERFFNIWYLMRYGRKHDKQRVIWLVKFLECWFSKSELEQRVMVFINKIKNQELDESTIQFFSLVYTSLKNIPLQTRMNLHDNLPKDMSKDIYLDSQELIKTAEKNIKEKKFNEGYVLLTRLNKLSFEDKKNIFNILLHVPDKDTIKLFPEKSPSDIAFTDFILFRLAVLKFIWFSAQRDHINEEFYKMIRELLYLMADTFKEEVDDLEFENLLLNLVFKTFIACNKANLAYKFFERDENDILKNKYEISYVLLTYFINNEDEALLSKLPDEKRNIILNEIEDILAKRAKFEADINV